METAKTKITEEDLAYVRNALQKAKIPSTAYPMLAVWDNKGWIQDKPGAEWREHPDLTWSLT